MGSHEKRYRWQCKKFDTVSEATDFAIQSRREIPITLMINVPNYIPSFFASLSSLQSDPKIDVIKNRYRGITLN
jgi:hypothetical protein